MLQVDILVAHPRSLPGPGGRGCPPNPSKCAFTKGSPDPYGRKRIARPPPEAKRPPGSRVCSAYLGTNCYVWDNAVERERERRMLAEVPRRLRGARDGSPARGSPSCTSPPPPLEALHQTSELRQGSEPPSIYSQLEKEPPLSSGSPPSQQDPRPRLRSSPPEVRRGPKTKTAPPKAPGGTLDARC